MFTSFKARDCKLTCMQGGNRIKLVRNKKEQELLAVEKQVAQYFKAKNHEMGMMRIEQVLRIRNVLKSLELLELFLEMIKQRSELIAKMKDMPDDMRTSICSVVFAAGRLHEVPELSELRKMFDKKYGKERMAQVAADDGFGGGAQVRLVEALSVAPPLPEDKVDAAMTIMQRHCDEEERTEAEALWQAMGMAEPEMFPAGTSGQGAQARVGSAVVNFPPSLDDDTPPAGGLPDAARPRASAAPSQTNAARVPSPPSGVSPAWPPPQATSAHGGGVYDVHMAPAAGAGPAGDSADAQAAAPGDSVTPDQPASYLAAIDNAMAGMALPGGPFLDTTNPGPEFYAGADVDTARGNPPGSMPTGPPPGAYVSADDAPSDGPTYPAPAKQPVTGLHPPPGPQMVESRSLGEVPQPPSTDAAIPGAGGKTFEQLQAEYDAVAGPPGKSDKPAVASAGGAEYPDVPPTPDLPNLAPAAAAEGTPDLPEPPSRQHDSVPLEAGAAGEGDVETDLLARLDRLRRGL